MSTGNATHQPDEGAVLLEQQGPIATITLSHPAALNALTWVMYQQMEAHLERLAADETTRVIILRGAGKAYAAGLQPYTDMPSALAWSSHRYAISGTPLPPPALVYR